MRTPLLTLVPLAVALSGCGGSTHAAGPAPSVTVTVTTSVAPAPSSAAATSQAPASPAAPAKTGCPAAGAGVPGGATSKPTIDVDGDGRADTEWAITLNPATSEGDTRLGVTTASGATFSTVIGDAGPTPREMFLASVDSAGHIAAIVGTSRGYSLDAIEGCAFVKLQNPQGQHYSFISPNAAQNLGNGAGCSAVAGQPSTLVGLKILDDGKGNPTGVMRTQILINGTTATNGKSDTVPVTDKNSAAYQSATTYTCGDRTFEADGVAAGGN